MNERPFEAGRFARRPPAGPLKPCSTRFPGMAAFMLLALLGILLPAWHARGGEVIRVGIYQFKPLLFLEDGLAAGLFPDVLGAVAAREGWTLQYVPGTWEECLDRLRKGEIDLLPAITPTPERDTLYDFTQEHLFMDWGLIYTREGSPIRSLFDLEGKRVAVLSGGINALERENLLQRFDITATLVKKKEYAAVVEALALGEVDAVGTTNMFSPLIENTFNAVRTDIVYAPVKMHLAVSQGTHSGLLRALDDNIQALKADRYSLYYASLAAMLGQSHKQKLPDWAVWGATGLGFASVSLFGIVLTLRKLVGARTANLLEANACLRDEVAERKRAEEALRASEERYRTIVQTANEGIWGLDQDGITTHINSTMAHSVGYEPEELAGRPALEFLFPEDLRDFEARRSERLSGKVVRYERRLRKKDGGEAWFIASTSPVFGKDGSLLGCFGMFADITGLKQAGKELKHHELYLRAALDGLSANIALLDDLGDILLVNKSWREFAKLNGLAAEAVSEGTNYLRTCDRAAGNGAAEARAFAEGIRRVLAGKADRFTMEYPCDSPDAKRWFVGRVTTFSGEGPRRAVVAHEDVTDRKLAEQALHESEEHYRILFQSSHAIKLLIDPETGLIADANAAACAYYGYSPEAFRTLAVDRINTLPLEELRARMMDAQALSLNRFEFRHRLASGEIRNVEVDSGPLFLKGRKLLYSIVQDITERKRSEEVMAASLREKEILLREIHHRVKNNLQIISSLLSLQEYGVDNPAIQDVLAGSRGRVASMALIHEQLYRSHDFTEIDVDHYLRKFIPQLIASCKGERDITLRLELAPIPLTLDQAIPFGLIMNELVTNALKHGFRGRDTGLLRVSATREEGDAAITVEDDGVGLPGDFRMESIESLGLQIVTMLTGQLRGTLAVEPGAGSCFRIRFPLRHAESPERTAGKG